MMKRDDGQRQVIYYLLIAFGLLGFLVMLGLIERGKNGCNGCEQRKQWLRDRGMWPAGTIGASAEIDISGEPAISGLAEYNYPLISSSHSNLLPTGPSRNGNPGSGILLLGQAHL